MILLMILNNRLGFGKNVQKLVIQYLLYLMVEGVINYRF